MGYKERRQLIRELQEIRQIPVVTHINSDRRTLMGSPVLPGVTTKLGTEAQPFFYDTLIKLGKREQIDLYLYTSGGQTDSVWPLVSIFREYGKKFNVLVPYKAHSAGTLICLGADKLVLAEASELSPVDPTTGNRFNPVDDVDQRTRRAISVEDVTSYFDLAKDPAKVGTEKDCEPDKVDPDLAFRILAEEVHPLALGNVNRSHKQIRELAKRLLDLHSNTEDDQDKIQAVVNALTQGKYSHTDILNRKEVTELLGEDMVVFANDEEQDLMWKLLDDYANALNLKETFILQNEIGDNQQVEVEITGAYIETELTSYIFQTSSLVSQRSILPPGVNLNIPPGQQMPLMPGFQRDYHFEIIHMGWMENERGL